MQLNPDEISVTNSKNQNFYVLDRKVKDGEDQHFDYKFYDLKNEDNIKFLAKLSCSFLNADEIDRPIVG
jgi:hypothetical protein